MSSNGDSQDDAPITDRSPVSDPSDWRLSDPSPDLRGVRILHRALLEIDGLTATIAREQALSFRSLHTSIESLQAATADIRTGMTDITTALLLASARLAKIDERTQTTAELLASSARDQHADLSALQQQLEHVTEQGRKRDSELGARLGSVEAELGEAPNEVAGRPGHGMRAHVATLLRDLSQRKSATAVAALGGAGGMYGIVEIVKLIWQAMHGG